MPDAHVIGGSNEHIVQRRVRGTNAIVGPLNAGGFLKLLELMLFMSKNPVFSLFWVDSKIDYQEIKPRQHVFFISNFAKSNDRYFNGHYQFGIIQGPSRFIL